MVVGAYGTVGMPALGVVVTGVGAKTGSLYRLRDRLRLYWGRGNRRFARGCRGNIHRDCPCCGDDHRCVVDVRGRSGYRNCRSVRN